MDEKLIETIKKMFQDGIIKIESDIENNYWGQDLVLSVKINGETVSKSSTTLKYS